PLESPQSNGMAEAFVRTIKRDYVRVSPRPDAETVMRQLPAWIALTTRFTRTRLSDIVHPVSSLQLTQDPDRVRSFGGYNNVRITASPISIKIRRRPSFPCPTFHSCSISDIAARTRSVAVGSEHDSLISPNRRNRPFPIP